MRRPSDHIHGEQQRSLLDVAAEAPAAAVPPAAEAAAAAQLRKTYAACHTKQVQRAADLCLLHSVLNLVSFTFV
jgi:hypothetical protein